MTKESCHGETAREMLCSGSLSRNAPKQILTLAPAPAVLPRSRYQGVLWPKGHSPRHQWLVAVVYGNSYQRRECVRIAARQGQRCGMCSCKPRALSGPCSPAAWHRAASLQENPVCCPVLAILSYQPLSKSQCFKKIGWLFFLKKKEILSFCFPASSHPMPLPPPPWNGSVPPHQSPASVGAMPHAHLQGKPGPSVLYSQKTLKSACQFTCKFILDATEGLQKKVY